MMKTMLGWRGDAAEVDVSDKSPSNNQKYLIRRKFICLKGGGSSEAAISLPRQDHGFGENVENIFNRGSV